MAQVHGRAEQITIIQKRAIAEPGLERWERLQENRQKGKRQTGKAKDPEQRKETG